MSILYPPEKGPPAEAQAKNAGARVGYYSYLDTDPVPSIA